MESIEIRKTREEEVAEEVVRVSVKEGSTAMEEERKRNGTSKPKKGYFWKRGLGLVAVIFCFSNRQKFHEGHEEHEELEHPAFI